MEGAGIGGGNEDDGNVTITGGTIKEATGGDFIGAAGIGGGRGGNADIKISNATIGTVTGGGGGSGIGTGSGVSPRRSKSRTPRLKRLLAMDGVPVSVPALAANLQTLRWIM